MVVRRKLEPEKPIKFKQPFRGQYLTSILEGFCSNTSLCYERGYLYIALILSMASWDPM